MENDSNINDEILNRSIESKQKKSSTNDLQSVERTEENNKSKRKFNKLDLLKLAENQDVEAVYPQDLYSGGNFASKYADFYDDVKQPNKYIKEDW